MKLGTVVYDGKIYNFDYMTTEEMKNLLNKIKKKKKTTIAEAKKYIEN